MPRQPLNIRKDDAQLIDEASAFPSREANVEYMQLSMRIEVEQGNRFKKMAKSERYSYHAFLEMLMDHYEQSK